MKTALLILAIEILLPGGTLRFSTGTSNLLGSFNTKWVIDGLLNFGAKFTQLLSFPIRFLQTGTFSTYALLILVGLAILLAYYQQHLHIVLRGAR